MSDNIGQHQYTANLLSLQRLDNLMNHLIKEMTYTYYFDPETALSSPGRNAQLSRELLFIQILGSNYN